ncbi:MAG: hypothetical protein LC687_04695 [Actinobacteria bacterium]|nr:hypothetical protein [Actinomycetota bacterium]
MYLEEAQEVVDILQGYGFDVEIYEDYSGRGMFGEKTTGIVVREHGIGLMIGYACSEAQLDLDSVPTRSDSLGLDAIYY